MLEETVRLYLRGRLVLVEGYWFESRGSMEWCIEKITVLDEGPDMIWSYRGFVDLQSHLTPGELRMIEAAADMSDPRFAGVKVYDPTWPPGFAQSMSWMVQGWGAEVVYG